VSTSEKKIKMEGLQVGMYVSRVDRPWSEMPTLVEGLVIQNSEDIDMLNENCKYVYVDTSKGKDVSPMYWIQSEAAPVEESKVIVDRGKSEYDLLRKETYETIESLDQELDTATEIHSEVSSKIGQTFDDLEQNKEINIAALKDAVSHTVNSVVRNPTAFKLVLELKKTDKYSYNHALGTSVWCAQFGRQLGLDKDSIQELALGGLVLDIGKTKLPESILNKKGSLSKEEVIQLRSHVDQAVQILIQNEEVPHNVMRMVATHHERGDGSGYPLGLENKDIPIYGRIAGIVDSFDAMTSVRPFGPPVYSPHEAISKLYDLRGTLFQADLVEQFIQTVGLYPTGSLVELNTGQVGVVTAINGLKRLRPTVMLVLDEDKKPLDEFESINLSEQQDYTVKKALKYGAYGIKMDELFL